MKRFHVHVAVENLDDAIAFYAGLFGGAPSLRKPDYAKWMMEDPRVNFAISQRGRAAGLDHLGLQVETAEELAEIRQRLDAADLASFAQGETTCCFARSEKTWTRDPAGIAWEAFLTHGAADSMADTNPPPVPRLESAACCTPRAVRS